MPRTPAEVAAPAAPIPAPAAIPSPKPSPKPEARPEPAGHPQDHINKGLTTRANEEVVTKSKETRELAPSHEEPKQGGKLFTCLDQNALADNTAVAEKLSKRRVKLMNLPRGYTPKVVASLVWGGNLELIECPLGTKTASVLFMRSQDCAKYLESSGGRIRYQPEQEGPTYWVYVQSHEATDPVSSEVQDYEKNDITRCIEIEDIDHEWTLQALSKVASGSSRVVERVYDSIDKDKVSRCSSGKVSDQMLDRANWVGHCPDPNGTCALLQHQRCCGFHGRVRARSGVRKVERAVLKGPVRAGNGCPNLDKGRGLDASLPTVTLTPKPP